MTSKISWLTHQNQFLQAKESVSIPRFESQTCLQWNDAPLEAVPVGNCPPSIHVEMKNCLPRQLEVRIAKPRFHGSVFYRLGIIHFQAVVQAI